MMVAGLCSSACIRRRWRWLAEAGRAGELHQAGAERRGAAAQRVEQGRAAVLAASLIAAGVELRSPIDGVIAELAQPLAPPPGQQVVALARVVAIDPLLLELPLPPADALPGVGARVEIFAGGRAREARVRSLAPLVDVAGLMVLLLEVPNADRALAAGLRASGTLAVGARTGAFVPADAIGLTRTGPCVWVASVDGLERRAVRVLADGEDGWVEVWGLAPGERLLADAARAPCCQALE